MAVIDGGDQDDTLQTGQDHDTINGRDGDDVLTNPRYNYDTLNGGAGDDILRSSGGALNILDGGAGNDTIYVSGFDTVIGGWGDDIVRLQNTTYSLSGGPGIDTLLFDTNLSLNNFSITNGFEYCSFDHVTISGSSLADEIDFSRLHALSGSQNPSFSLGDGNDRFVGTSLNDHVVGGLGDDTLNGGAGDDTLVDDSGTNILMGGDGNDTFDIGKLIPPVPLPPGPAQPDVETIYGGAGDDVIIWEGSSILTAFGGAGTDTLEMGGGTIFHLFSPANQIEKIQAADMLQYGTAGADSLNFTGVVFDYHRALHSVDTPTFDLLAGDDRFVGTSAAETVSGGDGHDVIRGAAGADILSGDAGDDVLEGGAGNDTFDGGDGQDTDSYASNIYGVTVSLLVDGPQDTLGAGVDTLANIENLTGSAFDDILTGDDHSNTLIGGAGTDNLSGGGGDDRLIGGLEGNSLTGGAGADHFIFRAADLDSNGPLQQEFSASITDFHHSEHDKIDIRNLGLGGYSGISSGTLNFDNGTVHTELNDHGMLVQIQVGGVDLTLSVTGEVAIPFEGGGGPTVASDFLF